MQKIKNILLVTPLYPIFSEENNTTYVCHYFARDWVKLGYNVMVVHIQAEYPWYTRFLINIRTMLTGIIPEGGYFYKTKLRVSEYYCVDGVQIARIPLKKLMPRKHFSEKTIEYFSREVKLWLDQYNFKPDIITGHMMDLEIIPKMNDIFNSKIAMVSHGPESDMYKIYKDANSLLKKYDTWGFRSQRMLERFIETNGMPKNPFICYSGIPKSYITNSNKHQFREELQTFIYVGSLINRKHPDKVIETLSKEYKDKRFSLKIVGEGHMRGDLNNMVTTKNLQGNIEFTGRIPRLDILKLYDQSDCMVMISEGEAYGLVYLEAMARGCITIGSRHEGIDGVIIDGVNGFLCEAGNEKELAEIINKINLLSKEEKMRISNNAIETARNFTDLKAAERYADDLKKIL